MSKRWSLVSALLYLDEGGEVFAESTKRKIYIPHDSLARDTLDAVDYLVRMHNYKTFEKVTGYGF